MLKRIFLLWAVCALFFCQLAAANSNEPNRQAKHTIEDSRAYFPPVLMYHDVKAVPLNYFDVSVEDFCAQLDWLKKAGYQTLSMEEFTAIVQKGQPFPKKSVVITFDDGYKGIYDYAAPELKKRGMKATFFIIPDLVGVPDDTYPYITKEELKELSSSNLFSIGSHTMSHPHLDQLEAEEKQKEICQSKKVLEEWTGRPVTSLAFPFGAYDKSVIKEVKAAGYQVSFAVQDRGLLHEKARYSIPRIYVGLEMGKDNLSLFQHYVKHYKDMPAAAFVERWEFFEE